MEDRYGCVNCGGDGWLDEDTFCTCPAAEDVEMTTKYEERTHKESIMTTYNIVEFNESEHVHSIGIVPNREEAISIANENAKDTGYQTLVIECPVQGLHNIIHNTNHNA